MIGDILQPTHLLFVLVIALIVLGPKRLPEVGRSLGKSLRDMRGAMSGIQDEINGVTDLSAPVNPPAAQQAPPAEPAAMVQSTPMGATVAGEAASEEVAAPSLSAAPAEPVLASGTTPTGDSVGEVSERVFGVPAMPQPTPAAAVVHEPLPSDYSD